MERSAYWSYYVKCWRKENHQGTINNPDDKYLGVAAKLPVYYGGRLMPLETYLEVPTFLRRGCRPAL